MKFDELLVTVGEFGPYQRRLYFLLSFPAVMDAAVGMMLVVFLFDVPQHRCSIPGLTNDSYAVQDAGHADLINRTIPHGHGNRKYSSCDLYSISNWTDVDSGDRMNVTKACDAWVFDKTVYESSVVQDMNLVCDRKSYVTHAKMMVMFGQLVALLISGPLSDMFGRKTVIVAGISSAVFVSICTTWVTNLYLLFVCVFLIKGLFNVQFVASFVHSMEIVGPSKRMITGVAVNLIWSAGNMVLALVAYLVRDWKTRQLVLSVPGIIFAYMLFATGMGFYGLSMNVTNLSGKVYLNFFLFVVVEACSYVLCTIFISRIGRRKMLCGTMLMAGSACIAAFIPYFVEKTPNKWIITALACFGNSCVSAAFATVYVFTAEVVPTTTRNFGMGLGSIFARCGSMLSPYISDLSMHISGKYSQVLPMMIFGGITTLAGLLALLLPETFNNRLPETVKDAEKLGTKAFEQRDADAQLLAETHYQHTEL